MPFDPTSASRAVLIEVMNVLGAYRDAIVLVGGWVPELLYPGRGHMGSLDVDLAVAPSALSENAYETIRNRLMDAGYTHQTTPTHFLKNVEGVDRPVKVDLVSREYRDGEIAASVRVDELHLNTLRGIDLAFEVCHSIEITGAMPDRTLNTVRAKIVGPEAFILIKAFALDERHKELPELERHQSVGRRKLVGNRTRSRSDRNQDEQLLRGGPPTVVCRAGYSKRRRNDVIPLHRVVIERLRSWLDAKGGIDI